MNEIKRLQQLAGIITEIKVNNPNIEIPSGWTDNDVSEFEPDEDGVVVKQYTAPMEGWDPNHDEIVTIFEKDGIFKIQVYIPFGDYGFGDDESKFKNFNDALREAVSIMNELKEDWEEDEDDFFEEELDEIKVNNPNKPTWEKYIIDELNNWEYEESITWTLPVSKRDVKTLQNDIDKNNGDLRITIDGWPLAIYNAGKTGFEFEVMDHRGLNEIIVNKPIKPGELIQKYIKNKSGYCTDRVMKKYGYGWLKYNTHYDEFYNTLTPEQKSSLLKELDKCKNLIEDNKLDEIVVSNPTDPNHIFRIKVKTLVNKIFNLPLNKRQNSPEMKDLKILVKNKPSEFSLGELRELIDKIL